MINTQSNVKNQSTPHIVFSVVSHGQLRLIKNLFLDLRRLVLSNTTVVLTINIPEDESCLAEFGDIPMVVIRNSSPKGFGENHNQAFYKVDGDLFLVVNPDIRLRDFSMEPLLELFARPDIGAVAPVVLSPTGEVEDSARRFPTFAGLLSRVLLRRRALEYQLNKTPIEVEWSAGMFVAFRQEAFKQVSGFDTQFFMYMEDADICRRLKRSGWSTVLQPASTVVHDAQRASRRSLRHMRWHLTSAFRFLFFPMRRS